MKILHLVEFYDPFQNGMQQVVKQLSERLAAKGHQITIGTSYNQSRDYAILNGVQIEQFKIDGNLIKGINGSDEEVVRFKKFVFENNFDVITIFAAQQWTCDLIISDIHLFRGKKVFVPTGFSGLNDPSFIEYYKSMKNWMQYFDKNVFLSEHYQDYTFADKHGLKNCTIIPNGAAIEEFESEPINIKAHLGIPQSTRIILTLGSHTGLKGHKEAVKIFNRAQLENSILLIVGNSPQKGNQIRFFYSNLLKSILNRFSCLIKKKWVVSCYWKCKYTAMISKIQKFLGISRNLIITTELNRQQIISAFKQSDLFLFPSNIECSPLVLFEAMAAKLPFLTSDVGNAKELAQSTNSGRVLPTTIDTFGYSSVDIIRSAEMLKNLFTDNISLNQLSKNGFEAVQSKYNWESIAAQYSRLYQSLIK